MFLHIENQKLLWQVLQKSPYLVDFTQKYPGRREIWFRGISENFYIQWIQNNQSLPSNAQELLEINKLAISFMIADLKKLLEYGRGEETANYTAYLSEPPRTRRELGEMNERLFVKYQTEYNQLLKQPNAPSRELPTESVDSKITNMEELVKEHAKKRDMDLSIYSPKTPPSNTDHTKPTRLRILGELDNTAISIEEYKELDDKKKSVHWSVEPNQEIPIYPSLTEKNELQYCLTNDV